MSLLVRNVSCSVPRRPRAVWSQLLIIKLVLKCLDFLEGWSWVRMALRSPAEPRGQESCPLDF